MRSRSCQALLGLCCVLLIWLRWHADWYGVGTVPAPLVQVPRGNLGAADPVLSGEALPECSLVFFFHIVKTGGTTLRSVLQRNAQLGDFEYVYTGVHVPQPPQHPPSASTSPPSMCA